MYADVLQGRERRHTKGCQELGKLRQYARIGQRGGTSSCLDRLWLLPANGKNSEPVFCLDQVVKMGWKIIWSLPGKSPKFYEETYHLPV